MFFVLGAADHEMAEIYAVLEKEKVPYGKALYQGRPVNSRTAYLADGVDYKGKLTSGDGAYWVETSLKGSAAQRFDHHNEGDAGFTANPSEYLKGSSLGQVLTFLGKTPSSTQKMIAAADHCLGAAYKGLCPEVDPDELLYLRAVMFANYRQCSVGDLMSAISDAMAWAKANFKDGRVLSMEPALRPNMLAEACAYLGFPIEYCDVTWEGKVKHMLKGGSPEQISQFMATQEEKGRSVYGNPHRGYAGAYL